MPARGKAMEGVTGWAKPLAWFAPLLIGALAFASPTGAYAAADDNFVHRLHLELAPPEIPLRVVSDDGETYNRIEDAEIFFFARIEIDLRWPGALDGIAIHLGRCTGHFDGCRRPSNPLIFLEHPSPPSMSVPIRPGSRNARPAPQSSMTCAACQWASRRSSATVHEA
jgi:hypothetical protein